MSLNFEDYFDLNEKWDGSDDDDEVNEEHCQDTLVNEENSENIQITEPTEVIRRNVVQEAVALFDNNVGCDTEIIRPEVGMTFPSGEEFAAFVYTYAYKSGFEISIRTNNVKPEFKEKGISRNCSGDKEPQFFMMNRIRFVCTKADEEKRKADDSEFTDCKVVIDARFLKGKSHMEITICRLEHNHVIHPENRRFLLSYRHVSDYFKRRALINDAAGISIIKSFNSMVLEAGGHENLPFNSRDLRNAVNLERRRSRLCGDAVAMVQYFEKMKLDNSDFFYAIERDIDGRLLNVFWADARCRSLFKSFSEVVSYDSTFGSNRFAMPFTPFVGVNHHGKSTLFAAALISHEDTVSYSWVFEKWIECMGKPPSVIITDQCKAIGTVKKIFPNTLHRLCLWHIMQNAQRNLGSCTNWKKIDEDLRKALHDSVDKYEFEDAWKEMVLKFRLEKNS